MRDADSDRLLGRGNTCRKSQGLCDFDETMAQDRFKVVYTRSLKLMRRRGGLIIYHGVMVKVELKFVRLHSVLIQGLRRKSTESRSLFSGKSE